MFRRETIQLPHGTLSVVVSGDNAPTIHVFLDGTEITRDQAIAVVDEAVRGVSLPLVPVLGVPRMQWSGITGQRHNPEEDPVPKVNIPVSREVAEQIAALSRLTESLRRRTTRLEAAAREHAHALAETGPQAQPYRNGVHIDEDGSYWMRRPDGWHAMAADDEVDPGGPEGTVYRLREKG